MYVHLGLVDDPLFIPTFGTAFIAFVCLNRIRTNIRHPIRTVNIRSSISIRIEFQTKTHSQPHNVSTQKINASQNQCTQRTQAHTQTHTHSQTMTHNSIRIDVRQTDLLAAYVLSTTMRRQSTLRTDPPYCWYALLNLGPVPVCVCVRPEFALDFRVCMWVERPQRICQQFCYELSTFSSGGQ